MLPCFKVSLHKKIKIRIKGQEISEGNCGVFNFSKINFSLISAALESKKPIFFVRNRQAIAPVFQGFALHFLKKDQD